MTILVIVESPSKCKKIEEYLGKDIKCIASYGHVRKLPGLKNIDVNNFKLNFEAINSSYLKKLEYNINNSSEIIIATDDDREGEAIGYHICCLFKLPLTIKRIKFNEITCQAVKNAYDNPTTLNMNLIHAAITRQVLDLLVGFTISPFLWRNINHKKNLSAGRCQTPALRLVYDNFLKIKNNPGNIVHKIIGYFTNKNIEFTLNQSLQNPDTFLEQSITFKHIFKRNIPTEVVKKSPKPFSTSYLQQTASNKLNISPKITMQICQKLYENGHITYMRTDSQKYSGDFIKTAKKYINTEWGDNYIKTNLNNIKQNDSNAHEAIRPTNINIKEVIIDGKNCRLYKLIWQNTCESMMADALFNQVKLEITAPLKLKYIYIIEKPIFLGWLILSYKETNNLWEYIFNVAEGVVSYNKIITKVDIINRVLHYSEAKLVNLLEEKGIGRPSTYASLVEKIKDRQYVKKRNIKGIKHNVLEYELNKDEITKTETSKELGKENNKLVIEPLGIMVIEFLLSNFEVLFKYEYTSEMESKLDAIANENMKWKTLCKETNILLMSLSSKVKNDKIQYKIDDEHTYIIGKYGPTIKWQKNGNVAFKKVNENIDYDKLVEGRYSLEEIIDKSKDTTIGNYKNKPVNIKKGPYGYYIEYNKIKKSIESSNITLDEAIKLLEEPSSIVYNLRDDLSIRNGKYGKYIFYKTNKMKKPKFYKLNGYDFSSYNEKELLDWIKKKYNI